LIRTPEEKRPLGRRRRKCWNIEMDFEETEWEMLTRFIGFGQGPVSGYCERYNEILGEEFLDKMSN
jgi:hypothetical protein